MSRLLKQPGYRLYAPDSTEAGALLAEQGLTPADLDRALARLERTQGTTVRTIVGINEDGVFGTGGEGWRPNLPDPQQEPFIPLLWLKIHEVLGRVPEGSTARFVKDGTLPGMPRAIPPPAASPAERSDPEALTTQTHPLRRRGLAPGGDLFESRLPYRALSGRDARRILARNSKLRRPGDQA